MFRWARVWMSLDAPRSATRNPVYNLSIPASAYGATHPGWALVMGIAAAIVDRLLRAGEEQTMPTVGPPESRNELDSLSPRMAISSPCTTTASWIAGCVRFLLWCGAARVHRQHRLWRDGECRLADATSGNLGTLPDGCPFYTNGRTFTAGPTSRPGRTRRRSWRQTGPAIRTSSISQVVASPVRR